MGYGHVLTNKGLQPDESKISAVRNYPKPLNSKAVHTFIGMVKAYEEINCKQSTMAMDRN